MNHSNARRRDYDLRGNGDGSKICLKCGVRTTKTYWDTIVVYQSEQVHPDNREAFKGKLYCLTDLEDEATWADFNRKRLVPHCRSCHREHIRYNKKWRFPGILKPEHIEKLANEIMPRPNEIERQIAKENEAAKSSLEEFFSGKVREEKACTSTDPESIPYGHPDFASIHKAAYELFAKVRCKYREDYAEFLNQSIQNIYGYTPSPVTLRPDQCIVDDVVSDGEIKVGDTIEVLKDRANSSPKSKGDIGVIYKLFQYGADVKFDDGDIWAFDFENLRKIPPPHSQPETGYELGELVVCIKPDDNDFGTVYTIADTEQGPWLIRIDSMETFGKPVADLDLCGYPYQKADDNDMVHCVDVIPQCADWESDRVAELFRDWARYMGPLYDDDGNETGIESDQFERFWGHELAHLTNSHWIQIVDRKKRVTFKGGKAIPVEG